MKHIIKITAWMLPATLPMFAFAAKDFGELADLANYILNVLSGLFVALAVVYFLYGVLKFVMSADDQEKRKEGTSMMFYGIIGIAVMVSVWALVRILINTFVGDDIVTPIDRDFINPF